jgi:putative spermidine/putrescine transport system permease protein
MRKLASRSKSLDIWLALPALSILVALIALPMAGLMILSLADDFKAGDSFENLLSGGFGLTNFSRFANDDFVIGRLLRTLAIGAIVTLGTLLLGIPLSIAIWKMSGRIKAIILALVLTPLLVSIVVSAYGWSVLLGQRGLINDTLLSLGLIGKPLKLMHSDFAIVIGLVHILLPFMVLNLLAALERVPSAALEAAATLGASPLRVHAFVTLPLASAGIRSGVLLVFSLAVSAFVTPTILGGNGTPVFSMVVYEQFSASFQWAYGAALAISLLLITGMIVALYVASSRSAVQVR